MLWRRLVVKLNKVYSIASYTQSKIKIIGVEGGGGAVFFFEKLNFEGRVMKVNTSRKEGSTPYRIIKNYHALP